MGKKPNELLESNCDIFKVVSSDAPKSQLSLTYIFFLVALSL